MTARPGHKLALLFAVALGGAAAPATAQAQGGFLGISPSVQKHTAAPPFALRPPAVRNTTAFGMRVRVFTALLTQTIDGGYLYREEPGALDLAKRTVAVSPQRFTLDAGGRRDLTVRWLRRPPRRAPAVYIGLVILGDPLVQGFGGETNIRRRYELVAINFLRLPGKRRARGSLVGLRGEAVGRRRLLFQSRVKNSGRIDAQPRRTSLEIRDDDGRRVLRQAWDQVSTVLPGARVEFPTTVRRVLPAGRYTAVSSMNFGNDPRRRRITTRFRLVGPNQLPTVRLALGRVRASGTAGEPAEVHAVVRNNGTATAAGTLTVTLNRVRRGGRPQAVARTSRRTPAMRPGESSETEVEVGQVSAGNYRVDVSLSANGQAFGRSSAAFRAVRKRSFGERVRDAAGDALLPLLVVAAIAALAFLAWQLARMRRRLRQAEMAGPSDHTGLGTRPPAPAPAAVHEPPAPAPAAVHEPAAPAPAPSAAPEPAAASPPGGAVDINSAGVEELMTLPGIGRRAAERLIAHREAHGPFASLDDLRQVEGFHAERIQRIAGSATV